MTLNIDICKNMILTLKGEITDVTYLDDLQKIIIQERELMRNLDSTERFSIATKVLTDYMIIMEYMITYLKDSTNLERLELNDMLNFYKGESFFTAEIKRRINSLWYEDSISDRARENVYKIVDTMKTGDALKVSDTVIDALIELRSRPSMNNMLKSYEILTNELPNLNASVANSNRGKETFELYSNDKSGIEKAIEGNKSSGVTLPFGVRAFDEILIPNNVAQSELLVVLSPSGGGKSRTLYELADVQATSDSVYAEIMKQKDKMKGRKPAILYYTFENTPIQVYKRLAGKYGVSEKMFEGLNAKQQKDLINLVMSERYGERVEMVIIYNKSGVMTAKDVAEKIKARENEKRLYFVHIYIDYADLIVMDAKYTVNRFNNATPDIVNKVADIKESIAVELKKATTTAAQLTTDATTLYNKAKVSGTSAIPLRSLSRVNIAGGRDLVQKADYVVFAITDSISNTYYAEYVLEKERSTRSFKHYDAESAKKLLKNKSNSNRADIVSLLSSLEEASKSVEHNDKTKLYNKYRTNDDQRYACVVSYFEQSLQPDVILESRMSLSANKTLIQSTLAHVDKVKKEKEQTEYNFE